MSLGMTSGCRNLAQSVLESQKLFGLRPGHMQLDPDTNISCEGPPQGASQPVVNRFWPEDRSPLAGDLKDL